ncbi:hypothetical protein [Aurantimonas sp. 22II-16-19i]|uniref:hypothetical protein n=1 Tax=Aurantimonas sp. 22II-16-19i TaxID=1317114 RepID=UPI0015936E4A|nr:hypothetical protein [Aurantimonas sp. 22II-16-19i]
MTGQAYAIAAQTAAIRADMEALKQHTEVVKDQICAVLTLEKEIEELRHEMGRRRD